MVDSSIALQWVLPGEAADNSYRYVGAADVTAPDILLIEAANVLAKKVRVEDMTGEIALRALDMISAAVGSFVRSEPLARRALEPSVALSHPVYDCVFLACAEQVGGKLATRDAPFAKRVTERGFGALPEVAA